jgi:hypothetical protein
MRHRGIFVDRGESLLPFLVQVKIEVTYVFDIAFRATGRMFPERVQT